MESPQCEVLVDKRSGFTHCDLGLRNLSLLKDVPWPLVDVECPILTLSLQRLIKSDGRAQKNLLRAGLRII